MFILSGSRISDCSYRFDLAGFAALTEHMKIIFSLLAGITIPNAGEADNSRLQGQFDETIMDQPAQTIDLPESFGTEPVEGDTE